MKRKRIKQILAIAILGMFAVACTNDEIYNTDIVKNKSLVINDARLENFLTFASFDDLQATLDKISNYGNNEQLNWENNNNFISLNHIYQEIDSAENKLLEPYDTLSVEELEKMPRVTSYTHDVFSDILIVEKMDDGSSYEDLNINDYTLSKVVNREGIIKIGDSIYQYKKNTIKIIKDGDCKKIKILNNIESTNDSLKISVIDLKSGGGSSTSQNIHKGAYKTNGVYKVIIYNDFTQKYQGDLNIYRTNFQIKIRVLKKAFGCWYNNCKRKIDFDCNFIGNCVSGYQIANNGSFIYHNQNWSGRFCGPTDSQEHTLELDYMATPYNPQITQINNKYYYYNQIGNLPHLFSVNNYVSVNCSSSRTITFEMNYINQ